MGSAQILGSALSVNRRGRSTTREKKIMASPYPNQREQIPSRGVSGVGGMVRTGIFKGTTSRRKTEKEKTKRRIMRMSQRVTDLML